MPPRRDELLPLLLREHQADHDGEEDERVADDGDGQPGAHHEAGDAEQGRARLLDEALEGVARLPRFLEAIGEEEEQIAVLGDAQVTAVLAGELVQAALGVAQRQPALGRGVGEGERRLRCLERRLQDRRGGARLHEDR